MKGAPEYLDNRRRMVKEQLWARGIRDVPTLAAMEVIPRELFVEPELVAGAYDDRALPAPEQQTVSQPYIVAVMTERLGVEPHHRVLEIGTGSGYQTAVLSLMARHVYSIERIAALSAHAAARLATLSTQNVTLKVGDGSLGWPEFAPFDRIMVTAAAPRVPDALVEQLAVGGRMIIPVTHGDGEYLYKIERTPTEVTYDRFLACRFVPLIGEAGYNETG